MTERGDDGLPWGYIHPTEGWIRLPKGPGLIAMGPPPFDVTTPSGYVRHVVHDPNAPDGTQHDPDDHGGTPHDDGEGR